MSKLETVRVFASGNSNGKQDCYDFQTWNSMAGERVAIFNNDQVPLSF